MSLTRGSAAPTPTMVASSSAQYSPKWPIFWAEFFFCSFRKKQNHFFYPFFKEAKKSISTGFCTQRQKSSNFTKFYGLLREGTLLSPMLRCPYAQNGYAQYRTFSPWSQKNTIFHFSYAARVSKKTALLKRYRAAGN